MKAKVIIAALVVALGTGLGSYYYFTKDKAQKDNTAVTTVENKENKDENKTSETVETKKEDKTTDDAAKAEKEKQVKAINSDIEKVKIALKANNINANVAGDFSKDAKTTLSASSSKLSKIEYVGENKNGTLSRNFSISIKHPVAEEFDITKYEPAKALIEKVIEGPLNDFEFSDGLSERMTTTKDAKMSYDFISGDNYKLSVNINKNAAETIVINIQLK